MENIFRKRFNRTFSIELYGAYLSEMAARLNTRFEFRLAETPVFIPSYLKDRLESAAGDILTQLRDPDRKERMKAAIPPQWNAPGMTDLPSFAQIDFAIVREEDGSLGPRLVELQGFPSLTAMQVIQRDAWAAALQKIDGLDEDWSCWFSGLSRERYLNLARRTIVGDHSPESVILMDLDPPTQKTRPDFAATKTLFGVDAVCLTTLVKRGRRLYRRLPEGREVRVERIYNRVVFDELIRKGTKLPFEYRDEIDVEWTPHPNWYWTWSKHSLPYLNHPAVPKATFLSDLKGIPEDLERRYVLKPLFSFAGAGVKINPEPEDLKRIPEGERHSWCLQEKIAYEPALEPVDGIGVKVEVRMMFLKPDEQPDPIPAQNLCRLSRGAMLGVDFNKDLTWVGSSVGLWPADGQTSCSLA